MCVQARQCLHQVMGSGSGSSAGEGVKMMEMSGLQAVLGCCYTQGINLMQMCSIILAIVLLVTAALSAVALLACRYQFWTFLQDSSASPPYTLRCGSAAPC